MSTFTEVLTASDADLVKIFYKVNVNQDDDFILKINKAGSQIGLNHTQLVCALGFNKHIRDLPDIYTTLGFRSSKLLAYRCNELFKTDTYNQLSIENILDIYSERLEDQEILEAIKELIKPRLSNIEIYISDHDDSNHVFSYRMEIHSIYSAGIVDAEFAEERLKMDISRYRTLSDELNAIIQAGLFPPSNLFYNNDLSPKEKIQLIEKHGISHEMIKNRLQNKEISPEERDQLEGYL
jgi:hypothetical protein